MMFHAGVISLLAGSLIISCMLLYGAAVAVAILRRWDIASSSDTQLSLERKTYLVSTIMNYVLGFEILSAFVFVYTLEDIHPVFSGAMCATGSLNANPVGWWVLIMKILMLFLSGIWIAVNFIDQKAEDYPLVKIKYSFLIILLPLIAIETVLQFRYFLGLKPDVITSCCGALFSESGSGLASSLASLPVIPSMIAFYGSIGLFLAVSVLHLRLGKKPFLYASSGLALASFFISLASVISFISLYFYEIPTHHCPFDVFQGHYNAIGYLLYGALFGGAFFGILPGVTEPLRRNRSLNGILQTYQRAWSTLAVFLYLLFALAASWPIVFSSVTLEGYY